jgi:hypothetical protein
MAIFLLINVHPDTFNKYAFEANLNGYANSLTRLIDSLNHLLALQVNRGDLMVNSDAFNLVKNRLQNLGVSTQLNI